MLRGQTPEPAARAEGAYPRTVRKWGARFKAEGFEGLKDRSSRPDRPHRPTPAAIVEKVEALRRQRWTGKQIAVEVGVSPATGSRILRRFGLNRIEALDPAEPIRRYERDRPGELIHIDIKKLGRFDRTGIASRASSLDFADSPGSGKRRGMSTAFKWSQRTAA